MAISSITANPDPIWRGRQVTFTINLDTDTPDFADNTATYLGLIRI